MTGKIIPLTEWKRGNSAPHSPPSLPVLDARARPLQDLRISLTDRCNFRCVYCMPKASFGKDYPFLPRTELLSFEEIQRLAKSFVGLGIRKIRLTGGEPLLRKGVEKLIEMLAQLETPNGKPLDLTMTTNGALLAERAQTLKDAGLRRITVSLDALDDAAFRRMSDADFPVGDVLRGLDAAHRAGLTPVKVNMVVKQGWNEHAILPMARYFKDSPFTLRFIEYMDAGTSNGWQPEQVVSSETIRRRIAEHFPLVEAETARNGEPAVYWRYLDGSGKVGFISSITQAFCGDCNRARLSTEGKLYTCLFANRGYDLRALLRSGIGDTALANAIASHWQVRNDRHSELRRLQNSGQSDRIEMSYIGG
ncbi:MAG: GTP 3',8-cyclase MoaA [Pseudomonadota bacterium]